MADIIVAKTAGFCFGVNRAVKIAFDVADRNQGGCTLGPIIHNKEMVAALNDRGVVSVDSLDDIQGREPVIIRSHGVKRSVYDKLNEMGVEYIDATCPFVAKIHSIVYDMSRQGYTVLIAGDENHPEVQGILSNCVSEYYIFKDVEDLKKIFDLIPEENKDRICIVAQTTFNEKFWKNCIVFLKKLCTNAKVFDTICNATSKRQAEAHTLSAKCDCMIVVGDRSSSNTNKLYEICKKNCEHTYLIETAAELDRAMIAEARTIGVTAGASTPDRIIKEVLDTMSENTTSSVNETENFEEMLEESLKSLNTNERVMGTVASITPNEVYVEVDGRKQTGFIPFDELSSTPIQSADEVVKVGDRVELLIMKTNDVEGTIMLSKRRVDAQKGFEELQKAYDEKQILTGPVTEVVSGGVIVVANDIRIFIPASQATMERDANLEDLKGQEVKFRLIEMSQRGRRRKIIGSIKSVLRDEYAAKRAEFWENCEVGKVYTGVVRTLTSYGAFVDLGGVSGMIHISELSWLRIKHPSEVVKVGDTVEVYIKDINTETKKISLGYKKTEDNPWVILEKDYPVGTVVKAKIVGLTAFGAFANIIPGIDGLIHISQISNKRIEKPADELAIGDEVEAKITGIDFEKKRVSLSIRALLPEDAPVAPAVEEEEDEVVAVVEPDAAPVIRDLEDETPAEEPAPVEEAPAEEAPAEEAVAEEAAPADAE
ncbi:bifunctional 4-hydroxy-3-methylbut-2-enyl diphosphate reductase/30S ribosomal protein S1 [Ruminococcus difficilis]|uniref:4-hydroxy-3-methylbut-2-enyl diphosphate reductase n=1 Tax=Ruminococcus difficilis TaxID=2763069 RepID=A0A934U2Q7_9FIRM|nr:bifunctional 4-hydroxy-3-methylbut-2-enyl diphosphate reductase/30S ribosomal protein S1 [Ruminococcus difficilis]MBK6087777.1 bifunctional 4-hydroxy-3-methylbut-2-enyl diphosphate reductase/30S ribosomal protein S1 [Ruminococcus difficilis]